jgi:tetratricopeptide (TPR) repeat protein
MQTHLTLQKLLTTVLVTGFCLPALVAQSNTSSAREHFERAVSFSTTQDPRAEDEYKQAIADRGGIYPEAWEGLSRYLAHALRFEEAAAAWRKYLKQTNKKVPPAALEYLQRLERSASLKSKSDKGQPLTLEERLELVRLVDGFGSKGDAVLYAEKAVELYPDSAKVLVALAELIKREQSERALELLNRAIAFEPNDPSFYVIRGGYFFWVRGNSVAVEVDFRKAIELSEGLNASAWAGLGDSLAREGRRDEAIAAYRQYLSIRPESAAHYDGEIRKSIEMLRNGSPKP